MTTDFNNKAVLGKPVFVGTGKLNNLPLDARTRIETLDEIPMIEFPYIGMMFYVRDEDKFYVVKSLKGEESIPGIASTFVQNRRIDQYEELNIVSIAEGGSGGNCNCPFDYDSAKKLLEILYDIKNGELQKETIDELRDMLQIQFPDQPFFNYKTEPWNPYCYTDKQIVLKLTAYSDYIGIKDDSEVYASISGTEYTLEKIRVTSGEHLGFYLIITCEDIPTGVSFKDGNRIKEVIHMCDVSKITDMSNMFNGCINLTTLDVSNWDTSNATNMSYMFYDCENLNSLNVSNWNVSNVTDMRYIFYHCFIVPELDVSNWDTSNVTTMASMFFGCSTLTSLDVSNFDTSKVTDMSNMISCSSLTSIDVSNFDTSNVTTMEGMFYYCKSLTSIDVSNFDTSNVTYMGWMFDYCESLTSIDLSTFDVSKVSDMYAMFRFCRSLTSLDLSNWNNSKYIFMSQMFLYSNKLSWFNIKTYNCNSELVDRLHEQFNTDMENL